MRLHLASTGLSFMLQMLKPGTSSGSEFGGQLIALLLEAHSAMLSPRVGDDKVEAVSTSFSMRAAEKSLVTVAARVANGSNRSWTSKSDKKRQATEMLNATRAITRRRVGRWPGDWSGRSLGSVEEIGIINVAVGRQWDPWSDVVGGRLTASSSAARPRLLQRIAPPWPGPLQRVVRRIKSLVLGTMGSGF